MCGIAGSFGPRQIGGDRVEACLALMRRRGPDHAAAWRSITPAGEHLVLLHSRLSIIDLDPRSHQPFHHGCATLVFNGELYNYLELRGMLEAGGSRFRTCSDTEVLAEAVTRWGWEEALERAEGMWALAHYDSLGGVLTLCRDRFGEKPLYWMRQQDNLYFGSEVKFLFALAGRQRPVNMNQIRRFLVYGYKSLYKRKETFFEGVRELPPATLLRLGGRRRAQMRRYWAPSLAIEPEMSFEQAVAGVR